MPAAAPRATAIRNAAGMTHPAISPASSICAFMNMPIRMLARFAMPPDDRSIPPVIIQIIAPSDIRPNSGNWPAIVWKLTMV